MYLISYIKKLQEVLDTNPGIEYFNVIFNENDGVKFPVIILTEDLENVKIKIKSKV